MNLNEAKQILKNAGYLVEHYNDKEKALHDFLIENGFKHKPRHRFGLFKEVDSGELMVMAGMGSCTILYNVWDADKKRWTGVDIITVKHHEDENAFKKLSEFIEQYVNK